jgi:hypothetical protein
MLTGHLLSRASIEHLIRIGQAQDIVSKHQKNKRKNQQDEYLL